MYKYHGQSFWESEKIGPPMSIAPIIRPRNRDDGF